jgi:HTH-type transcriptional regulator / antitoxin HigA
MHGTSGDSALVKEGGGQAMIKNEEDFDAAVNRMEELWGAKPETPQGDELGRLIDEIWDYQEAHHTLSEDKP